MDRALSYLMMGFITVLSAVFAFRANDLLGVGLVLVGTLLAFVTGYTDGGAWLTKVSADLAETRKMVDEWNQNVKDMEAKVLHDIAELEREIKHE